MAELKPCPFCGSNVSIEEKEFKHSTGYLIGCDSIDCFVSETVDSHTGWFANLDYLIDLWNTRASNG